MGQRWRGHAMGYRQLLSAVLVALTFCVAATGTAATRAKASAEGGALASEELQAALRSFADSWASQLSEATARLATQMATPQARYHADRFGYFAFVAAVDIAAGPSPGAALLDMLVLVTLNRMVWDEYWMPQVYGEPAAGMVTTLRHLEADLWALAARVLTPTQRQEVQEVLRAWRTQYPDKTGVSFIRFSDFGALGRKPALEAARQAGGVLAPLKQAAQAAEEISLVGDRALYLLLRMQELLYARAKLTVQELFTTPELAQLVTDVTGFRQVSERYAALLEALPAQLTAHLRGTIDQTLAQGMRQSAALTDHVMQQVAAERQAVMRQSAALTDHVMQQVAAERQASIEQAMRGLDQERQVTLAQLLQGVAHERQALLVGLEQVLTRGERHAEHWLTHGFVLLAALMLIFFMVRLAYRYAADGPGGAPPWRWVACAGLCVLAVLVVVTVLAYVQRGFPLMLAMPEAHRAQRHEVAAGGQGVEPAPDTTPVMSAPAAPALVAVATTTVPPGLPPVQGTPSSARQYVVQKGDTLRRIAARVYGDGSPQAWKRIYDENKAVIGTDPSQLRLGMRLTIPES